MHDRLEAPEIGAARFIGEAQFDAAVRFCGKVFGAEYAATLTKAAEVALANERKAAERKAAAAAKA